MKKFLPHIVMGIILIISIVGVLVMTQQKPASTQQEPKLNKIPLPQLTTKIAKNESKLVMRTTYGDITIKLFNRYTPLAVENFITHAKDGYYNNTSFHRVINNFMIQGGDPTGTGSGGQSIWKDKDKHIDDGNGFKNEISSSLYNIRGAVAMANAGTDTNTSQFFIVQNPEDVSSDVNPNVYPTKIVNAYKKGGYPSLDGNYTVFGQVIDGMAVVDKIASSPVIATSSDEKSKPTNPVKITNIEMIKELKKDR
ncbi:peptidylprolyl isomerase [Leuconostoc koreense]|nr:peptidylprolyl isomerase [Leuconostoc mesenteroides]QGM25472.1 peptidylprolyl isomerase [Leuconostoc mesenteroides subsp. mesenteroides]